MLKASPSPAAPPSSSAAAGADGSIRIHACHSAMREIEVLHDQLLDIFDAHPRIQPRDVMVLTPDIAVYAPYVHAVFGTADLIPYSVADESVLARGHLIEGFMHLLDLKKSRLEVSGVLGLLENPLVRSRFDLTEDDLILAGNWITQAGIRWGWSPEQRRAEGLPAFAENTWRSGLDRLLLGYVMSGDGVRCYKDILPLPAVEGSERRILGSLIGFMETLRISLAAIPDNDTLSGWMTLFETLGERFFQSSDEALPERQILADSVARLGQIDQALPDGTELPFEAARQHLAADLEQTRHSGGFITGGVTICAALPMRSIPAEVICMVGLNHDTFPRETREPGFNLIEHHPRLGDRNKRDDDKYLFLETLISARTVLYLSYIGRHIQDNAPIPPSTLVEELIDYLARCQGVDPSCLVREHPLHGFSMRYFSGAEKAYFSYSKVNAEGSRHLEGRKRHPDTFFDQPLPATDATGPACVTTDLLDFLHHPARFLLQRRLGIQYRVKTPRDRDREAFTLDALDTYRLSRRLLDARQQGYSPAQTYQAARASGELPHGAVGRAAHQKTTRTVQGFMARIDAYLAGRPLRRGHGVDLTGAGLGLTGMLEGVHDHGVLHYRVAKERPQDLLRVFTSHLIAHLSPDFIQPLNSSLICQDAVWDFEPVADARAVLQNYLDLYQQGLVRPVAFFPRTSFAFATQRLARSASRETALLAAWRAWQGGEHLVGEAQDPYNRRCFGGENPLNEGFEDLALRVFEPLLAAGRRLAFDAGRP